MRREGILNMEETETEAQGDKPRDGRSSGAAAEREKVLAERVAEAISRRDESAAKYAMRRERPSKE
jgi:hypothetical protein